MLATYIRNEYLKAKKLDKVYIIEGTKFDDRLGDLVQPKTSIFLHALSFECTTKLCINFLNQFLVCFHI